MPKSATVSTLEERAAAVARKVVLIPGFVEVASADEQHAMVDAFIDEHLSEDAKAEMPSYEKFHETDDARHKKTVWRRTICARCFSTMWTLATPIPGSGRK